MKIYGEIRPPGDKSISHRAFMFGAIAKGETGIYSSLESEDIKSTRESLKSLGVKIIRSGDAWIVHGGSISEPEKVIDAGNSGTTARLLSGILAGMNATSIITGDSSLIKRPMGRIISPLSMMGAVFLARHDRYLPMAVKGGNLKAISYQMDIASAQVKSAIMIAGIYASGVTRVTEPSASRDHTERMLPFFGAKIRSDDNTITLEGPQNLEAREISIPGDPSSAAFPAVLAAATPGSELRVKGVCLNPTRTAYLDVLKRMGADISFENLTSSGGEPVGDFIIKGKRLEGTKIQGDEIPGLIDEIPVLAVAASLAEGETIIRDAKELRVKETDRIRAIVAGFDSLGAHVNELEDGLIINGPLKLRNGHVKTYSDHRIAMSFYILSKAGDFDLTLDDAECVGISYPGFFDDIASLL